MLSSVFRNSVKRTSHIRLFSKYHLNDQICIHEEAPNHFKFNLSSNPSALAIGYCDSKRKVEPDNFIVNDAFLKLLHKTIGETIQDDFSFIIEAGTNANAFMPIYDFREIPRYARIPEVENIFGYVMVDGNARIIPGTYEGNDLYRIINGKGLLKLSDHLYEVMQQKTTT